MHLRGAMRAVNQQLKQIQEELGQDSPDKDIEALRVKAAAKKWDEKLAKVFNKELDKLMRTNPAAPDFSITFNYCELLLELPWNEFSKDFIDLKKARKVLDNNHFGLDKVEQALLAMKVIFITHIHSDHNLGILNLISQRKKIC